MTTVCSTIELLPELGEDIIDCINMAIRTADYLKVTVKFVFNDVKITATSYSSALDLYHKYCNAKEGDTIC